jgi:hypothetical protein
VVILDDEGSEIAVKIEYTELTWGTDVLRHLEADLKNKIIVESWWVGAISNIISLIGLFIIPAVIAMPPTFYFLLQDAQRVADKAEFMHTIALDSDSQESIIRRLDYLIEDHRSNPLYDARFWVYMATIVLVLASIALFVLRRPRSYLILNAAAQKHKLTSERRRRAFESSAAVTIALGVISELVGAHLSDWINRLL